MTPYFYHDKFIHLNTSTALKVSKYGVKCGPNAGKYGLEITPYLDTFHAEVTFTDISKSC